MKRKGQKSLQINHVDTYVHWFFPGVDETIDLSASAVGSSKRRWTLTTGFVSSNRNG